MSSALFNRALELSFFKVFGNKEHQAETEADNPRLFNQILKFLMNQGHQKLSTILNDEEDTLSDKVKEILERKKNVHIFSYFAYASALIIERQAQQNYPNVYLVYTSKWGSDWEYTSASQTKSYPIPLPEFNFFKIGQIQRFGTLEEISNILMDNLKGLINKCQKDPNQINSKIKNHHSPSWLRQACQQALERINGQAFGDYQFVSSKGGTLDVGFHVGLTKPDTVWTTIWAIFSFLAEDAEFISAFILAFKTLQLKKQCDIFYKELQDKKEIIQSQFPINTIVSRLYACMQELRGDYENICAQHNYYHSNKKSVKALKYIAKAIHCLNVPAKQAEYTIEPITKKSPIQKIELDLNKIVPAAKGMRLANEQSFLNQLSSIFVSVESNILFTNLIALSSASSFEWILCFEDVFFTLAINELTKPTPFSFYTTKILIVAAPNIESQMAQLLSKYYKIIHQVKSSEYGSHMPCQMQSHFELMKIIFCIIAFEVVRRTLAESDFAIEGWRVPVDFTSMYCNFNSLSFKARAAMQSVMEYCQANSHHRNFADLKQGYENFRDYADRPSKLPCYTKSLKQKQNKLLALQNQLSAKIQAFHAKHKKLDEQLQILQGNPDQCYYQTYQVQQSLFGNVSTSTKTRKVECQNCKNIKAKIYQINQHERLTEHEIPTFIPHCDELIHELYLRLPPEVEGLMHLCFAAQTPNRINYSPSALEKTGYTLFESKKIIIHTNIPSHSTFKLLNAKPEQAYTILTKRSSHILQVKWMAVNHQQITYQYLSKEESEFKTYIFGNSPSMTNSSTIPQKFINSPEKLICPQRQHQIYADLIQKSISLKTEEYLALGSARVTEFTQIPIILESLCRRDILINTTQRDFNDRQKILYRCLSQMHCMNPIEMEEISSNILEANMFYFNSFLLQYSKNWNCLDFMCFPSLGPIISLICRTVAAYENPSGPINFIFNDVPVTKGIKSHPLISCIVDKIFVQYYRIEEDNKNRSGNDIKYINTNIANQCFIIFGGLCLFTEQLIDEDDSISIDFVKMISIYYFKSLYFTLAEKYSNIKPIVQNYKNHMKKAIEVNINSVCKYFVKNPKHLNQVISFVDENVDKQTQWNQLPGNKYVFRGVDSFKSIYLIDIKSGKITKNGQALSRIPEFFKSSDAYKRIFGVRDFEIFPSSTTNSIITKQNFADVFGKDSGMKGVYFEFNLSESHQVIIKMVIRYENLTSQEKWTLLNMDQIKKPLYLPRLYRENTLAWYNEEKRCIVFRKPELQHIRQVFLAVFLTHGGDICNVQHVNVISKQHQTSPLSLLCDRQSKIFSRLIIRQRKTHQAYDILSNIEHKDFILELQEFNGSRKFWLHRFDLIFRQNPKQGLIPESFHNYKVSLQPFSHKLIPWNARHRVSCLVLQKFVFNDTTQQQHKIKIMVPYEKVNQHTQISFPYPNEQQTHTNDTRRMFIYEIHDHFGQIRGTNRLAQLHLVSILASLNTGLILGTCKMSCIEYAIKVFNSCFNNCPLTAEELDEVFNLLKISYYHKFETLILMCDALLRCTSDLEHLNLSKYESHTERRRLACRQTYSDILSAAVFKYNQKMKDGRIPLRQKIPVRIAKIFGLNSHLSDAYNKGRKIRWREKNKIDIVIPSVAIDCYIEKYEKVLSTWRKLNKRVMQVKPDDENEPKKLSDFPLDISTQENQVLLNEVVDELKKSYEVYQKGQTVLDGMLINKGKLREKFLEQQGVIASSREQIEKILTGISLQNKENIDIFTGYLPILSKLDYVNILIENNDRKTSEQKTIDRLYPGVEEEDKEKIVQLIKIWLLFCIKLDSCERVLYILSNEASPDSDKDAQTDKIALYRECESPRKYIEKRIHWVCFEAEMKIQIWRSQFITFQSLIQDSQSGSITQLNMGEGKTQIIIPMIALELFYSDSLRQYKIFKGYGDKQLHSIVPRVNLMESLINESFINYFKFLSITSFNIPIAVLPFDRKVNFSNDNIKRTTRSLKYFGHRTLILLDQSSTHSMMLKLREEALKKLGGGVFNKEKIVYKQMNVFDIFDEVDAQLVPKKSFIYSIGGHTTLDQCDFRVNIAEKIIDALCLLAKRLFESNYITFDETFAKVQKSLKKGQFPKGYRLISNVLETQQQKVAFRKTIAKTLIFDIRLDLLEFLADYKEQQINKTLDYLVQDDAKQNSLPLGISLQAKKVLYTLRGFLAYGLIEHCFSLRCNVNYGIPGKIRKYKKRLAIPYEAADIPSKKNDFAHPEVSIILSYLAYFNFGLTDQEIQETFVKLINETKQNEELRNFIYQDWRKTLCSNDRDFLRIDSASELVLSSGSQKQRIFKVFKLNRKLITYWLKNCVFSKDTAQFDESITSSSWDHADVECSIGFSGTKDNCRLLPSYVNLIESKNQSILGTDGKMLDMLIKNTLEVVDVKTGSEPLLERFFQTMLNLPDNRSPSCIIDAGAVLATKSLDQVIVPELSRNPLFNKNKQFKGVSLCVENSWKVYKAQSHEYIDRGTSIHDSETFVIFDEYRTRGADIKMKVDIIAILTLSPSITKDSLMQAIGRLRKFGRNQKLIIFMTEEVKTKIKKDQNYADNMNTEDKVKAIISWSCLNSVRQNQKFLVANCKLASIHFTTKKNQLMPTKCFSRTKLDQMYAQPIVYKLISELCEIALREISIQLNSKSQMALKTLENVYNKYGQNTKLKAQNFEQVCQRQAEIIQEQQEQKEIEMNNLRAKTERDQITPMCLRKINKTQFSDRFKASQNFLDCTEAQQHRFLSKHDPEKNNELMYSYFVEITNKHLCMITLREVNQLILKESVPFYMGQYDEKTERYIARLSDLHVSSKVLEQLGLVAEYVQCKVFNGESEFDEQLQLPLLKQLFLPERGSINSKNSIQHFLVRRRQISKYNNSSLEKLFKKLSLMPVNGYREKEGDILGSVCQGNRKARISQNIYNYFKDFLSHYGSDDSEHDSSSGQQSADLN